MLSYATTCDSISKGIYLYFSNIETCMLDLLRKLYAPGPYWLFYKNISHLDVFHYIKNGHLALTLLLWKNYVIGIMGQRALWHLSQWKMSVQNEIVKKMLISWSSSNDVKHCLYINYFSPQSNIFCIKFFTIYYYRTGTPKPLCSSCAHFSVGLSFHTLLLTFNILVWPWPLNLTVSTSNQTVDLHQTCSLIKVQ